MAFMKQFRIQPGNHEKQIAAIGISLTGPLPYASPNLPHKSRQASSTAYSSQSTNSVLTGHSVSTSSLAALATSSAVPALNGREPEIAANNGALSELLVRPNQQAPPQP
nr:hypothetical protein CFP56_46682 [Quercus suber]